MLPWVKQNLLSIVVFMPLLGVIAIAALPRAKEAASKYIAISFSLANLLVGIAVYMKAHGSGEFEMVRAIPWIPSLGIYYRVGADGASALMILMTTIIMVVALLASWSEITKRLRLFYGLMLLIGTGLTGVFASTDMFLFFVFWDAAIIPMCFVIGIWGSGDRIRVAMKFLIFTAAGSLAMLVAILYGAAAAGSFNLVDWYAHDFPVGAQLWLFTGFALAFAIKVPLIGFHTWLPDSHTEAPTAGSIVLAGVMLKLGAYGFFRLAVPLFPHAASVASPVILTLAVTGVVLGALLAMVQDDFKRLIAYSSISHMGLVVLGIFSLERYAATGALFQMASHGLIIAGLFATAGFLYERRGTRLIADYGGSASSLPMMSVVLATLVLGAIGLPGLSGFAGEFMILLGSFQTETWFAAAAVAGTVLIACYLVWVFQRICFGRLKDEEERKMPDMRAREYLCVLPIVIIIVVAGVWPKEILGRVYRSADAFVALAKRGQLVAPASASLMKREKVEDGDISR